MVAVPVCMCFPCGYQPGIFNGFKTKEKRERAEGNQGNNKASGGWWWGNDGFHGHVARKAIVRCLVEGLSSHMIDLVCVCYFITALA